MSCIVLFPNDIEDCFPGLFFVHVSTFMTLMTTDLEMDKVSCNYHYTVFTDRLGGG